MTSTLDQLRQRFAAPAAEKPVPSPGPPLRGSAAGRCVFPDREQMFKLYDAFNCPACGRTSEGVPGADIAQMWHECAMCNFKYCWMKPLPATFDQTESIVYRTKVCKLAVQHIANVYRERPLVGYAIELDVYNAADLQALLLAIQMPQTAEMVVDAFKTSHWDDSWLRRVYFTDSVAHMDAIAQGQARVLEMSYESLVERMASRPMHDAFKFADADYKLAEADWQPALDWARSNAP